MQGWTGRRRRSRVLAIGLGLGLTVLTAGLLIGPVRATTPQARIDRPYEWLGGAPVIDALLEWIDARTDYDVAAVGTRRPQVIVAPGSTVFQLGGEEFQVEPNVRGAYSPKLDVIFLTAPWDPSTVADLSVLLHELVHAVQFAETEWPCMVATEPEAWRLQARWLAELGFTLNYDPLLIQLGARCP